MTNPELIIICSNTLYDENPLGARPLADALAKKTKILYVDPPFSIITSLKQKKFRKLIFSKKYIHIDKNISRLTPLVLPGKDRPFIYKITSFLVRRKIRKIIKSYRLNSKPALITTAPHYNLFTRGTINVYWIMDDYISQPELTGINKNVLVQGHKYQLENSDLILCASSKLLDSVASFKEKSNLFLNGADSNIFTFPAAKSDFHNLPHDDFALYVGGINDRIDLDYLKAIADNKINLVIAGAASTTNEEFNQLCAQKNVYFLGSIPYDDIAYLMNLAKVGLVPYKNNDFNNASMPLKITEYLLCGLEVISTNLDFINPFDEQDVHGANNPNEFVLMTKEALSKDLYPSIRVMRSSRIASIWSWDIKAQELLNLL